MLEKYSELKRIRYTTSHPVDMTDDLIECYSSNKKLMPFIHLPIQSGSDKVLKLMNRKHKVEDYLMIYDKLMKINPSIKESREESQERGKDADAKRMSLLQKRRERNAGILTKKEKMKLFVGPPENVFQRMKQIKQIIEDRNQ